MSQTPEAPQLRDPSWWAEQDAQIHAYLERFQGLPLNEITPALAAQIAVDSLAIVLPLYSALRAECLTPPPTPKPTRTRRSAKQPV